MNYTPRAFRPVSLVIMLALLAITWVLLAPPAIGGSTSFVVVNGNSMEPVYARGDLILVRARASYHVGEIVTYRHPQIGPVIHRIIGQTGDRWLFKGDNNSFVDPFQPRDADLIGGAVLRVPLVGGWLMAARDPRILAVLVVGVGMLFMQRLQPRARGRRNQPRAVCLRFTPRAGMAGVAALVALLALGVSAWAYLQPVQRAQTEDIAYTHAGAFAYRATAPAGIYDTAEATAGQPIFWQLSNRLDVAFDYQLQAGVPATLKGMAQLDATLSSADGWRRTLVLSQPQPFDGAAPTLRGSIDLAQIRALIDGLERSAGLPRREYLVTISPRIQLDGMLAGEALRDTFAPKLVFRSDEFQLSLVRDEEQDPLAPTQAAILKRETLVEQALWPNMPFSVANARIAAPLVLLFALVVGGWFGVPLLRSLRASEAAQIRLKYGALLADAAPTTLQPRIEVAVATIDGLARIAERHGTLMLHDATLLPPRYLVCNGETVYVYRAQVAEPPMLPAAQVVLAAPPAQTGWHAVFLQELRVSGAASEACRSAGVALSEAYRERESNRAFAHAWESARASALNQRSHAP